MSSENHIEEKSAMFDDALDRIRESVRVLKDIKVSDVFITAFVEGALMKYEEEQKQNNLDAVEAIKNYISNHSPYSLTRETISLTGILASALEEQIKNTTIKASMAKHIIDEISSNTNKPNKTLDDINFAIDKEAIIEKLEASFTSAS